MYIVLLKYAKTLEVVSCDEALLEINNQSSPEQMATKIRKEIYQATGCTASVGIGKRINLVLDPQKSLSHMLHPISCRR